MVMLRKTRRLHFVGIGGIGMSGIAEVLVNLGYQVTGSDLEESAAGDVVPPGALINVNTASKALLETLPDIGPTRAQRIIESRTQDGPYHTAAAAGLSGSGAVSGPGQRTGRKNRNGFGRRSATASKRSRSSVTRCRSARRRSTKASVSMQPGERSSSQNSIAAP